MHDVFGNSVAQVEFRQPGSELHDRGGGNRHDLDMAYDAATSQLLLFGGLAGGRVEQFVDAVLMVVSRQEYDIGNPMLRDELQERITLCTIATHPRFAAVVGNRRVGARRAA